MGALSSSDKNSPMNIFSMVSTNKTTSIRFEEASYHVPIHLMKLVKPVEPLMDFKFR